MLMPIAKVSVANKIYIAILVQTQQQYLDKTFLE